MEYLKDPVRFADLFNGILFDGKQVIDAKYLSQKQRKKRLFLEAFPQDESDVEKTQEEITQKKKIKIQKTKLLKINSKKQKKY